MSHFNKTEMQPLNVVFLILKNNEPFFTASLKPTDSQLKMICQGAKYEVVELILIDNEGYISRLMRTDYNIYQEPQYLN